MNSKVRWICTIVGAAAVAITLAALPVPSQSKDDKDNCEAKELARSAVLAKNLVRDIEAATMRDLVTSVRNGTIQTLSRQLAELQRARVLTQQEPGVYVRRGDEDPEAMVLENLDDMDEGSGWLGVETRDVNGEKAKELKLPGERGVLLVSVVPDSPAAKAGLKENDVITEINSQRVEGALQFRRMIHEIPSGRTVQLGIIRDGRAQTISVTLGKADEHGSVRIFGGAPARSFSFRMPEMPRIQVEPFEFQGDGNWTLTPGNRVRLGIDGEDLGGQLGSYFGAPDGEGILVREVQSGSAADKAGLKAGDVLVKFDGGRLRSIGDLREKLSQIHEEKSVKLGVLRNHSEISLTATLAPPQRPKARKSMHSTDI